MDSASEALELYRQAWPSANNKVLAKLVGSDWQRHQSLSQALLTRKLYEIPRNQAQWVKKFGQLMGMNRRQAFRAFMFLPRFLLTPDPVIGCKAEFTETQILEMQGFYVGVGSWLLNWDLELRLSDCLDLEFGWCQDYARVSELRYQMIRRLCELKAIDYPKPAFPWLLSETSACLARLNSTLKITNKRESYKNTKDYIKKLKEGAFIEAELNNLFDHTTHQKQLIDTVAGELAERDKKFKRQYFASYVKALTTWNGKTLKNGAIGIEPKRPGPSLRSKYYKEGRDY